MRRLKAALPWRPRLAAPNASTDRWAQARQPHRLLPTQAVQLLPSWSHLQTRWSLHHRSRSSRESTQELLRSLHKGGSCSTSGNCLQGWTFDLVGSSSEASAGGEPFGGCLRLWFVARSITATVLCTPAPFYSVYTVQSLYINRYVNIQ